MTKKTFLYLLLIMFILSVEVSAQAKKSVVQSYEKVVTKEYKTDEGLFKVHSKDDTYLFEIPDSLLKRDMLLVTRVAKIQNNSEAQYSHGGLLSKEQQVLRWERRKEVLFLKVISYNATADSTLPIHEAVVNSNLDPIFMSFPIKAFGEDNKSIVIDVTSLFSSDIKPLGLPSRIRKKYKVSRVDKKRSYIHKISSYPKNIESRHIKTYFAKEPPSNKELGSLTVEMSNSIVLLPKVPMKRRYFDKRIGFFERTQFDFGSEFQGVKKLQYIDRYRLEVKDEDIEKFKRGELVEPKKQIVYYIDRATPEKWIPYIIEGVNDWQVAFEQAGFKNAIIAKRAPTKEEDPEYTPEDIRYSVIRYIASKTLGAEGPYISDPRSGEILNGMVLWHHNVMSLLRAWFITQTSAINSEAQRIQFKNEVMGELIRFVSSHEVGHTIGLSHNMGSSSAYPVDSLRSATFTKKFGISPSIMDYARFNYIAQPNDKGVSIYPKIGIYDKYAVNWGYRPILDKVAKEEKLILDSWILKHAGDPLYRFGKQNFIDPSSQTEDLGDDPIKASRYGIANLKRIVPNLIKWTSEKGEDYFQLNGMYSYLLIQFQNYQNHVLTLVGGVYENLKTSDQNGAIYTHVSKENQKEAINFFNKEVFTTPTWIINENIINRLGSVNNSFGFFKNFTKSQEAILGKLLDKSRIGRMIENEILNGSKAYTVLSMVSDLRKGIWSELYSKKPINAYRRNLQRVYINKLKKIIEESNSFDLKPIVKGELKIIKKDAKKALSSASNMITRYHLQDIIESIDDILD
ncbi:zinc-dependent metalloprotease [uncultured Polaribacter sp.]|uniref:zinc-dependent metalloprotease n=1 Tax=uncultured Polaribacter sp. TaxID=174711 RepID=UPI00261ED328|nr:zinc-dependent metalloprotease [uncultured Polaribacter sp.]